MARRPLGHDVPNSPGSGRTCHQLYVIGKSCFLCADGDAYCHLSSTSPSDEERHRRLGRQSEKWASFFNYRHAMASSNEVPKPSPELRLRPSQREGDACFAALKTLSDWPARANCALFKSRRLCATLPNYGLKAALPQADIGPTLRA